MLRLHRPYLYIRVVLPEYLADPGDRSAGAYARAEAVDRTAGLFQDLCFGSEPAGGAGIGDGIRVASDGDIVCESVEFVFQPSRPSFSPEGSGCDVMVGARSGMTQLWNLGYSSSDIVGTIFKVTKDADLPEKRKLEFLKEIGVCQLRIAEGATTLLQLLGLVAKMCEK